MEGLQFVGLEPVLGDGKNVVLVEEYSKFWLLSL